MQLLPNISAYSTSKCLDSKIHFISSLSSKGVLLNGNIQFQRNTKSFSTNEGQNQFQQFSQQEWIDRLKHQHESVQLQESGVNGIVYLVGTGPGDPGMLTLKALQLMQTADVILYDRLVSNEILRLIHGGALMVYVGKQAGFHTRTQDEIHEMLVEFATQGKTVLRLKGGDPFVFGRGGEEVEYLSERGVDVHIVPGITAAMGISSDLGIPLTHRGLATSVRFLTGHTRQGGQVVFDDTVISCGMDQNTTLVIYMGLNTLEDLAQRLQAAGMRSSVPVVAVERGTTPQQRAIFGRLNEVSLFVKEQDLKSPTLIIIGEVVSLSRGWQKWISQGEGSRVYDNSDLIKHDTQLGDVVEYIEQKYLYGSSLSTSFTDSIEGLL